MRGARSGAAALALLLVSVAGAPACSGGKAKPGPPKANGKNGSPVTDAPQPANAALNIVASEANRTQPPSDQILGQVKDTIQHYIDLAVVAPLKSGAAAPDLSPAFTGAGLAQLTGPNRAAMVDEGFPPASKAVTISIANLGINSVSGPDGATGVIAAEIDLQVHAIGPAVDMDVHKHGQLVLVPDGGTWKIDAFTMHSTHDSRGASPTPGK